MSAASILIVENEAIVAADLASLLERLGYTIAGSVAGAERAIELAREHRPSLVLMDIRLAGPVDGISAAGTIRRELDLPVVFLTAHSGAAILERAKAAEAYGYIVKPFEEQELHATIETALSRYQAERRRR